ncbi:hypothetical protein BKA70DRAFT_1139198 [Coprinopsis sp. MPI-PUGE-AT-0042]|nr:hypothetical protein BKA70DRAFT_1139198 [Coprinopsis sp. MPI-PUGE-AT-0042]
MSSATMLTLPDISSITVLLGKQRVRIPRRENYEELLETIRFHFPDIKATEDISLQTKEVSQGDGEWVDLSPPFWHFIHQTTDNVNVNLSPASEANEPGSKLISIEIPELCRTLTANIGHKHLVGDLMEAIQGRLGFGGDFNWRLKFDSAPLPKLDSWDNWGIESNDILTLTQGEPPSEPSTRKHFPVDVHLGGRSVRFFVSATTTVSKIRAALASRLGIPVCEYRLIADCQRLADHETLAACGITERAHIHAFRALKGAKPVIYVLPPKGNSLEVQVDLSLAPQWEFSAIYPVVNAKASVAGGQSLRWSVTVKPDGTLREHQTGMDVSYLYWEADTTHLGISSPPPSPLLGIDGYRQEQFIPNRPSVDDGNSVMLSLEKLPLYLDHALRALGLHTEARTSFITYWLPSFNKHKNIALRFLPQAAYEASAPLDVLPKPDVVARIFMLFQGVEECDVEHWPEAAQRVSQPVQKWQDVVGIDPSRVCDTTLYRVIEWGGMEIRA